MVSIESNADFRPASIYVSMKQVEVAKVKKLVK